MLVTVLHFLFDLLESKVVYVTLTLAKKYKVIVEVARSYNSLGSYLYAQIKD
jgi:hypothetical protein